MARQGVSSVGTTGCAPYAFCHARGGAAKDSGPKNGETAATARGREAHKNWDPGKGFVKEQRLPSGKRADAVDYKKGEVKELKPDNERAIKKGERQVEQYRQELQESHPEKCWTCKVETYKK